MSGEGLSLEIDFETKNTFTPGLRFILACGAVGRQYNFALAQWRNHLIFFLKTSENPSGKNILGIEISQFFSKCGRGQIAIIRDGILTKIYVDGVLVHDIEIPGSLANWDSNARLFVGSDDSGEHSWEGYIYKIAVYDHPLPPEVVFSEGIQEKQSEALLYYDFEKTGIKDIVPDHGGRGFKQDLFISRHFRVIEKRSYHYQINIFYFLMS